MQDDILTPWENVLAFDSYAVRVRRADIGKLPQILRAIPQERVRAMQTAIATVWERFTFSSVAMAERDRICDGAEDGGGSFACRTMRGQLAELTGRDAVDTLMHVLYARLLAKDQQRAARL